MIAGAGVHAFLPLLDPIELGLRPSTPPGMRNRGFLLLSCLVLKVSAHPVAIGW
jgi:hypothetical protein